MNYELSVTPFSARFPISAVGEDGDIPGQRTEYPPPPKLCEGLVALTRP
jgi:hypothetical protein